MSQLPDDIGDITMASTEADSSQTHAHEGDNKQFSIFKRWMINF